MDLPQDRVSQEAGQTVVALAKEFAKLDWPYFPYVYVPISDLIHDERNLPVLIKRCCVAAKRQGVPWHVLVQFNLEVLQQPNYTLAWCVCVRWFDTVGEYVPKPVVAALEVRTGAIWLFQRAKYRLAPEGCQPWVGTRHSAAGTGSASSNEPARL